MSKPNLVIIVEGQTEISALPAILTQHLYTVRGCYAQFPVIGKIGKPKGGHKSFEIFLDQVKMFAKQYPGVYISSYFDYYGFNPAWEEWTKIKQGNGTATEKVSRMEQLMASKVCEAAGPSLWPDHFLPYIQLHELEALLFADTDILGSYLESWVSSTDLKREFSTIKSNFNNCEEINDSPLTAPSKRIESLARYKKGKSSLSHAGPIMEKIGLATIRQECPRFNEWVTKLESLPL